MYTHMLCVYPLKMVEYLYMYLYIIRWASQFFYSDMFNCWTVHISDFSSWEARTLWGTYIIVFIHIYNMHILCSNLISISKSMCYSWLPPYHKLIILCWYVIFIIHTLVCLTVVLSFSLYPSPLTSLLSHSRKILMLLRLTQMRKTVVSLSISQLGFPSTEVSIIYTSMQGA